MLFFVGSLLPTDQYTYFYKRERRGEKYHFEFGICLLDIGNHSLDIIINAIEHRALVDNHRLQLTENIRQLDNPLGNIVDFAFALRDGLVVVCADEFL